MGLTPKQIDTMIEGMSRAAMAPYERAQQSKENQAERDARLAQLIKGDQLKREGDRENFDMARNYVEDQARKGRKVSANIAGASVTQSEIDPMDKLASFLRLREMQDQAKDRRITQYQKNSEATGDVANKLGALESQTHIFSDPKAQLETRSGVLGKAANATRGIPLIGSLTQGLANAKNPQEAAALQDLQNTLIKESAGLAQTASEAERQAMAAGQLPGADASTVRTAYQAMATAKKRKMIQERSVLRPGDYVDAEARGAYSPSVFDPYLPKSQAPQGMVTVTVRNAQGETHVLQNPTQKDLQDAASEGFQVVK